MESTSYTGVGTTQLRAEQDLGAKVAHGLRFNNKHMKNFFTKANAFSGVQAPNGQGFIGIYSNAVDETDIGNAEILIDCKPTEGYKKSTDGKYRINMTLVTNTEGTMTIFFDGDNTAQAIILMDLYSNAEFAMSRHNGIEQRVGYNGAHGIPFVFGFNRVANGYVSMCPVYLQDSTVGKKGDRIDSVMRISGINNDLWSPSGLNINGKLYYGCETYCTDY